MSGPRNTEPQVNGALALALRRRNPDWNDKMRHWLGDLGMEAALELHFAHYNFCRFTVHCA